MEHVGDVRAWVERLDAVLKAHFREGIDSGALTGAEAAELMARINVLLDQGLAASH